MKKERKRKALAATVCGSMLAIALVGGTLAYLQDEDSDYNVMTLGNVSIEQIEQERVDTTELPTAENNLKAFTQAKPLYPAVFDGTSIQWNSASEADQAWKVVESNANVIDKFVTVKNTGKSAAYVRTLIAYEGDETYGPNGEYIHVVHNGTNVDPAIVITCIGAVNVKGVDYTVYEYVYPEALAAGETSIPSLKQVYMNKAADNGVVAKYGDTYDILVLSQAVQTEGFENARTALDTAFGKSSEKAAEWFGGDEFAAPVMVATADGLSAALSAGENVVLTEDVQGQNFVVGLGESVKIDGNGNSLAAGYVRIEGTASIENVDMNVGSPADYGNIAYGSGAQVVYDDVEIASAGGGIGAADGAKVTFNSGSVDVSSESTSGRYNFYAVGEGTVITINGGEFSFSKTYNQKRAYIYAGAGTTVIVNGGTFGPASTRSGYTEGILGDGTVMIYGGTFEFDPSSWVADGYKAVQEGSTWTVVSV